MSIGIQILSIICGTFIAFVWIMAWYSSKNDKKIKNTIGITKKKR